jgi:hypothetical protein
MARTYNAIFEVMQVYGIERTYQLYEGNAIIPAPIFHALRNQPINPQASDLLPQPTLRSPLYTPVIDAIEDYRQLGSLLSIVGMYQQLTDELSSTLTLIDPTALSRKLRERNRLQQSIEIWAQYFDYIQEKSK